MSPFEKGHTKLGGRKKGVPNKSTVAVMEAVRRALDAAHKDGAEGYLLELACDDPKTFMSLLTALMKLIPTAVETKVEIQQTVTIRRYGSGRKKRGSKKKESSKDA